jgi:peptide/nickel transport system substrate-binding protein
MRHSLRWLVAAAVAALATMSLAGGAHATAPAAKAVKIKTGGALTYINPSDNRSLDAGQWINCGCTASTIPNALYDVLFWEDPVTLKIHPQIATSFTTQDGKTWTMKIRQGVKFTDGTTLDATAVKFSWDRMKDPALGSSSIAIAKSFESTVVDPQTLTLTLQQPNYRFATQFQHQGINWVVSPTAVQKYGADFGKNPVGAGPFILQSWQPNTQTVLVRNPNYWNKPLPYLDQITFKVNPDGPQSISTVAAGQANATELSSPNDLTTAKQQGLKTADVTLGGATTMMFNTQKPPFNDPDARRAVVAAIDIQKINESAYNGNASMADNIFTHDSPYYDKSLNIPYNDPKKAQQLFDSLAQKSGGPLKFSMIANQNPTVKAMFVSIQTQLASFKNVQTDIVVYDQTQYITHLLGHDFTAIIAGSNGDPEPSVYEGLHTGGSVNWGNFSDPQTDQALDQGRSTTSDATKKSAYKTLQQRVADLAPLVWLNHADFGVAFAKSVSGFKVYGNGNMLVDSVGFTGSNK